MSLVRRLAAGLGTNWRWLFLLGIALRVIVFAFLGPFNADNHLAVIRFIGERHSIPRIDQLNQAYHPPLYYLMGAAIWGVFRSIKAVQLLSLVFSIATLYLAWCLIANLDTMSKRARFWSLMLVSLHPQFILFTLFISNDSPAILLGVAMLVMAYRYIHSPDLPRCVALAGLLGLGLLTKATFLAFIPALVLLILVINRRHRFGPGRMTAALALFLGIACALGSYKFVENARVAGRPLASNLDMHWEWVDKHKGVWSGPSSILDVNLMRIIRVPVLSAESVHSYPLMMYGTFWYSFLPESTFRSNQSRFQVVGSMIYVFALLPTLAMLIGLGAILARAAHWAGTERDDRETAQSTLAVLSVLILLTNVALVFVVGWKHDVWSVFQSRLLFPSYLAFALCLGSGADWIARHSKRSLKALVVALGLLHAAFIGYFLIEISLSIICPVDPSSTLKRTHEVRMTRPDR